MKTVHLFFILGHKYFKSLRSKWTSSQTLNIFKTLMLFYFLLQVCESARSLSFCTQFICVCTFCFWNNKIKYCFESSIKILWVTAISAGGSLEGQQTIFYFRPCVGTVVYHEMMLLLLLLLPIYLHFTCHVIEMFNNLLLLNKC